MKIAIPTFVTRVSPRFDCAQSILVLIIDEGRVSERRELVASDWTPHERISRLLELGVDTILCGGIDRWSVASLQSAGVTIYGWMSGEVEEALTALLQGDLDAEAAMGARGRCACRRFPGNEEADPRPPGPGQGRGGHGRGRRRRGGGRWHGPAGP